VEKREVDNAEGKKEKEEEEQKKNKSKRRKRKRKKNKKKESKEGENQHARGIKTKLYPHLTRQIRTIPSVKISHTQFLPAPYLPYIPTYCLPRVFEHTYLK
jgi:hypothetical protein